MTRAFRLFLKFVMEAIYFAIGLYRGFFPVLFTIAIILTAFDNTVTSLQWMTSLGVLLLLTKNQKD